MNLLHTGQLTQAQIANLPTAAEKAALDGASPALSETNVVVGSTQLGPQLTPDQAAAIEGATNPNTDNPFVTAGSDGAALSLQQLGAIQAASPVEPDVRFVTVSPGAGNDLTEDQLAGVSGTTLTSSSNPVAATSQLLQAAASSSDNGSTVTWATGRSDLNSSDFKAVLIYLNTAAASVIVGSIDPGGDVTFAGTFTGGGTLTALLFYQTAALDALVVS